jgi:hypothetical protein
MKETARLCGTNSLSVEINGWLDGGAHYFLWTEKPYTPVSLFRWRELRSIVAEFCATSAPADRQR